MKIFTIGAGFVSEHLQYPNIKDRLEINVKQITHIINTYKPDVLINCIGKTGRPNIDWCESHQEETATANTALPILLAEACTKHSVHLIHIGSGCVYFEQSPHEHWTQGNGAPMPSKDAASFTLHMPCKMYDTGWREEDFANPKSFYSKTKYACDLILGEMKNVTTLRIRMPVSEKDHPRNLINKLRGYKQVIDIPNSMTFMSDFVRCVDWAAKGGQVGIFHVTNPQPLTAARIMQEFQKYVPDHTFEFMSEQQLDAATIAKRSNCILDSQKLASRGFSMTPSESALAECMLSYIQNINWRL